MLWKTEVLFVAITLLTSTKYLQAGINDTVSKGDCILSQVNTKLKLASRIFEEALKEIPTDLSDLCKTKSCRAMEPMDCSDIYENGHREDGVYQIFPRSRVTVGSLRVYCDMTSDGGGWTVIQRRGDFGNPENYFYRDWSSYKAGFGDIQKDFWIGNDNMFALTNQRIYKLRIDLADWDGITAYASYDEFWISDEIHNYNLHVHGYSGSAGDSFSGHNGYNFTTKDRDNDIHVTENCATTYSGAWWYLNCLYSNLNGLHYKGQHGEHQKHGTGVEWERFKGLSYSLRDTVMKIRR